MLLQFARAGDAAAATTKKLQKYAILADYFRGLDDDDLRLAVRYAAGRPFAATDDRTLNVGGALVSDVALALLGIDPHAYHDLCVRSGEIGEALSAAWAARVEAGEEGGVGSGELGVGSEERLHTPYTPLPTPYSPPPTPHSDVPLTLSDLSRAFDALASTGAWEAKRSTLYALYARCHDGREAAYLTKIILGDMRTGVQEGVLHYAIAQAFGRDLAQIQRCQLLTGDLGEVAVLAKHDACGTATFRLFHPVMPMLATAQDTPDDAVKSMAGRTFYAEDKLDGIRAQVHKAGDGPAAARVTIYTRDLARVDASFPDVVEAVSKLPGDFLLDGEIVPWRAGVVLPFAHIQKRLGRKVPTAKVFRDHPAAVVAFDILYRDRRALVDEPLRVRRAALASLAGCERGERQGDKETGRQGEGDVRPSPSPPLLVSLSPCLPLSPSTSQESLLTTQPTPVTTPADITAAFDAARGRRNEGIVLKDSDSPYSPGRRGQAWLKLKTHLPTLDCVVTAAETGHGKRRNWLSDYTFAVWDRDPAEEGARLV